MFFVNKFKKHCSDEWLAVFEKNSKSVYVQAGERIFREADPVKGIYFIEQGKVKVLSGLSNGEERIIRIAGNGGILGHRAINTQFFYISAEALTDTHLTYIPMNIFLKVIRANPGMAIYLINFLSDELRDDEDRMKKLLVPDPRVRIAVVFVKIIDCFGYNKLKKNKLDFTLSRTDFANMAGTTYETVIRTLALFKESGLISLEGKEIVILNESELRRLAAESNSGKKSYAKKTA